MKMTTKQLYGTGLLISTISTVALLALVGCEVGPGSKPPAVDPTAQASLSVAPNPVAEGSAVVVTATLSAALSNDVTIPLTLSAGTAETGDYGALASITITAGATTGTGKVTTAQDDDTDDETFTVALGSLPSSVTAGSPSSVEVTIEEDPAQVSLSATPNPVAEGSAVVVTATLSAALSNDVTIPLTLSAGTAETGDYGALASITITAGATTGTGKVTTAQDDDTDDETFTVALGSLPSSVTAGSPSSVEVTIDDDDTAQSAEPDLPYAMRWWDVLSPEQRERALYGATATDEQARAAQIDYGALDTDTKKEVNATAREIFGAGGHESVGAWWQTLDCRERRIAVGDGNTDDSESPYCAEYPGS